MAGKKKGSGRETPTRRRSPRKFAAILPATVGPDEVVDGEDPGDATQRNFRYQHAYGVILLIGAATGRQPYVAIWCEQHEDILAQRTDGKWDGYQVKTRQRENGDWHLGDADLCNGFKHLATLDGRFPNRLEALHFVSNARFFETAAESQLHRSPVRLLDAVRTAPASGKVAAPFDKVLADLGKKTALEPGALFGALRKTKLVSGPERESFDAEIAHNHVPTLAGCSDLSRTRLSWIRDELVARVYRASSLFNEDPARHWCCVTGDDRRHPNLAPKRVSVDELADLLGEARSMPFRYLPGSSSLAPGSARDRLPVFQRKLIAAGLESQVDSLQARMLATELRLLELTEQRPEQVRPLLDQIENVVKGEYGEAQLAAELSSAPYGQRLLNDVYGRLRVLARERGELIDREPYETLVGVAAMLTAECQLWWGPRFDLGSPE